MTRINLTLPQALLAAVDREAKKEGRSRSELLQAAARMYVERKRRWESIFACGRKRAIEKGLKESDVLTAIAAYRKAKRGKMDTRLPAAGMTEHGRLPRRTRHSSQ